MLGTLLLGAAVAAWVGRRQPPWVAGLLARCSRRVLFAVPTARRAIALTFDDGPHPDLTPALLDVLARHGVRATFFLLGAGAQAHPDVVARIVEEAHEVANHTWADRPSALLSAAAFAQDVDRTHRVLTAAGGHPRFLRPGSGWFRPSMLRTADRRGYRVVLGSIAVLDLEVADVAAQAEFVLQRVRPGAVVVLHEGYAERAGVVALTDRVLTGLAARGYAAATLTELTGGPRR